MRAEDRFKSPRFVVSGDSNQIHFFADRFHCESGVTNSKLYRRRKKNRTKVISSGRRRSRNTESECGGCERVTKNRCSEHNYVEIVIVFRSRGHPSRSEQCCQRVGPVWRRVGGGSTSTSSPYLTIYIPARHAHRMNVLMNRNANYEASFMTSERRMREIFE